LTGMNQNEINNHDQSNQRDRDCGVTIMMIEHNVSAMMSLCDRIMVINYGQKITEGLPKEILSNEKVIEAYLARNRDKPCC